MDELAKENRRIYMREYMQSYRSRKREQLKEYTNRYWQGKGRAAVEVRNLEALEAELQELKCRAQ